MFFTQGLLFAFTIEWFVKFVIKTAESINLHRCCFAFCCMICYLTHNIHEWIVCKVVSCSTWMAVKGHGIELIVRFLSKSINMDFSVQRTFSCVRLQHVVRILVAETTVVQGTSFFNIYSSLDKDRIYKI